MEWIVAKMKWVMLLSGVLTLTMIYAAIDPQASLRSTFGETLEGPVAEISKLTFITLVLVHGTHYLGRQAGVAIAVDSIMVLLFAWYLLAARREPVAA